MRRRPQPDVPRGPGRQFNRLKITLWAYESKKPFNFDPSSGQFFTPIESPPIQDFVFEFFLPGILLNCVGVLGLVGNLISIFILSRPQMKGSTNCILIGLATYDIILILSRYACEGSKKGCCPSVSPSWTLSCAATYADLDPENSRPPRPSRLDPLAVAASHELQIPPPPPPPPPPPLLLPPFSERLHPELDPKGYNAVGC